MKEMAESDTKNNYLNSLKTIDEESIRDYQQYLSNSTLTDNIKRTEESIIKLSILNNGVKISYVDSGKGLSDCYKSNPEKILDAFESDKRDENGELVGTGMGMWIVNKIVKDYNGNINLSKNTTKTNGFEIEIELFSH